MNSYSSYPLIRLTIFLFLYLLNLQLGIVHAAPDQSDFKLGITAAKNGDYQQAILIFESLIRQGKNLPILYYNLGVSYYKLAQYQRASAALIKINDHAKFGGIASYNLGLIAYDQYNYDEAYNWFNKSLRRTENAKLQQLNLAMLETLQKYRQEADAKINTKRVKGIISSYITYDDNVDFANDETIGISKEDDVNIEIFANFNANVFKNSRRSVWFAASLDYLKYASESQNDFSQFDISAAHIAKLGSWNNKIGARLSHSRLRQSDYQRQFELEMRSDKRWNKYILSNFRYRTNKITSLNPNYDYLEGWRHNVRVESMYFWFRNLIRIYYDLELNNRQDLQVNIGNDQISRSYSPLRHKIRVTATLPIQEKWRTSLDFMYRLSNYPDDDVINDNSFEREETQKRYAVSVFYILRKQLELIGELIHTNNNATIDASTYQRTIVSVGANWYY